MPTRRSWISRYGIMLLSVGLAFLLTWFVPQLRARESFVVFLGSIMFSAWFGGWGPGVAGSILSAFLSNYYIVQPPGEFTINSDSIVTHVSFLIVALMISYLTTKDEKSRMRILENQKSLQSLASELSLAEERERRQIATALHDRIGQTLALSNLKLREIRNKVTDPAVQEWLEEISGLLKQMLTETRSLTFELSPPILYEFGLDAALEWLCNHFKSDHKLECKFCPNGSATALQLERRITLFQVVRELLTNVVKHAQARNASVTIQHDSRNVTVTVTDDGIGFDPSTLSQTAPENHGLGLFSIGERIRYMGGTIRIDSGTGRGTQIALSLPLTGT